MKDLEKKIKLAFVTDTAVEILKDIIPKLLYEGETIKLDFGEVSSIDMDEMFNRMNKIITIDSIEEIQKIPDLNDINPIILEEYKDIVFFIKELKNPTMDLDSFLQAEASLSY